MSRASYKTGYTYYGPGPEPVPVWLNRTQIERAYEIGRRRFQSAVDKGWVDYLNKASLDSHRYGAVGESAAAEYLGVPWDEGVDTGNVPDIFPNWQVRWSKYPSAKVKDTDKADWNVILVMGGFHEVGGMYEFYIRGSINVDDARVLNYGDPEPDSGEGGEDRFLSDPGKYGKPQIFIPVGLLKAP
jgi:hypothetical protein